MRSAVTASFLVAVGCASASPVDVRSVRQSEVVPAGYASLGDVEASCTPGASWRAFHDAPATSLVCDRPLLERALAEKAARRGGTLLALTRCGGQASGVLSCSAVVARPRSGGASILPTATFVGTDSDALSPLVAARIAIDLEPSVPRFTRRSRPGAEVAERAFLPVGHEELGVLRARCDVDACSAEEARAGLRAAAGALGVSDLVGVRCAPFGGERTCVAALAASERDPDMDAAAR